MDIPKRLQSEWIPESVIPRYNICCTWIYYIDYKVSGYLRVLYPGIISAASGYTQINYKVGGYLRVLHPGILSAVLGHTK